MSYQAYLASPSWAVKREAVRVRCEGICELCNANPMQATHHLTYANIYAEDLTDLMGVCEECHLSLSGKGKFESVRKAINNKAVLPVEAYVKTVQLKSIYNSVWSFWCFLSGEFRPDCPRQIVLSSRLLNLISEIGTCADLPTYAVEKIREVSDEEKEREKKLSTKCRDCNEIRINDGSNCKKCGSKASDYPITPD